MGVLFGDIGIAFLLFADDVVLLASLDIDLQHILGLFAVECEDGVTVISDKALKTHCTLPGFQINDNVAV